MLNYTDRTTRRRKRIIHSWNGEKVRIYESELPHFIRAGYVERNTKLRRVFFTAKDGFFDELARIRNLNYA